MVRRRPTFRLFVPVRTNSPLRETLYLPNSLFDRGFSKVFGEGVNVGFIGLFDTVASLGGLSNLGNVRSPATPGVKMYLMPHFFPNVLQLVARDEYRANFALNSVSRILEISLPGVHSDIGGGYRETSKSACYSAPCKLWIGEFTDVKTPRSTERHNRNERNGTPRAGQWRCWN